VQKTASIMERANTIKQFNGSLNVWTSHAQQMLIIAGCYLLPLMREGPGDVTMQSNHIHFSVPNAFHGRMWRDGDIVRTWRKRDSSARNGAHMNKIG
jgi:hypothetical protein